MPRARRESEVSLSTLREHLAAGGCVVRDGAMGTELERRGVPCPAPLWSAAALESQPQIVRQIHAEYVAAGAGLIVANTFRTNPRTLRAAGLFEHGERLNCVALRLANEAAEDAPVCIAASVAPVGDCYRPELVPREVELVVEHALMMAWLRAAAGESRLDLVWIETMNTVREARAAAEAARRAGFEFAVNYVLREDGALLDGEPLEQAVAAVEELEPAAIGLNCIPPRGITRYLPALRELTQRPIAVYAHINNARPTPGWSFAERVSPAEYGGLAARWRALGAAIVGGCCGTTPEHIAAVSAAVKSDR